MVTQFKMVKLTCETIAYPRKMQVLVDDELKVLEDC